MFGATTYVSLLKYKLKFTYIHVVETGVGSNTVEAINWNRNLQTIVSHFRFHPEWRPYRRQRRFCFRSIVNLGCTKRRYNATEVVFARAST